MRNNGAVFDFNIIENSVQYVKCYESAIYHVYKINNNEIFTNGANDYKNENYAIKILDNNLNITKEYKGYSESYKFKHNNKGQFLIFSDNQYLDPDKNIHLFNYKMEEQASINIKDYIADVSYSFDGNFILIGHGYGVSSVVSIYSLEGEYIKSISIETNDIYERIDMVLGSQNEIIVVLGKSER